MPLRLAVLFLVGAPVFCVLDGFHTFSGTTEYTDPWLLRMAWWTPVLFGSVVAGGGAIYAIGHLRMRGPSELPSWPALGAALSCFGALYFATGFWKAESPIKLAAVMLGAALMWAIADRSWQGAVLCIVSAVGGCAVEITLVSLGAFRYLEPDVLGVPWWLPGLYVAAGPAVGQLGRRVLSFEDYSSAHMTLKR